MSEMRAGFRSLTEAIDTTTPAGRMMMQMVRAFAEFERAMLREHTKSGLEVARREGRIGGRKPKLPPQQKKKITRIASRGDKNRHRRRKAFQCSSGHDLTSSIPGAAERQIA